MNIGLMHYRVGETDGVSLEMNKWKLSLEKMGHKVVFIAGNKGNAEAYIIPELSLDDPEMKKNHFNAYYELKDYNSPKVLINAVNEQAEIIERKLLEIVRKEKIDLLVPNNILSLGHHLSAAIAINNVVKKENTGLICHHHDFYWERVVFNNPTCNEVKNILDNYFPPLDKTAKHCVINSIAQKTLKNKKGLDSIIVPNVFDFEQPCWGKDDYNSDLRSKINIKKNDLVFLQATRITDRKAIELAIDLINQLNRSEIREKLLGQKLYNDEIFDNSTEIILLLPGLSGEKESATGYKNKLIEHAKEMNVKLIWCNELLEEIRITENGIKKYSLWDFYTICDFITYPSIQEGWGNQFLEAVFAKKPMVIFEYPVFLTDIKQCGFEYISLGENFKNKGNGLVYTDNQLIYNAAEECINILKNKEMYNEITNRNFVKGKVNYSLEALQKILEQIFKENNKNVSYKCDY